MYDRIMVRTLNDQFRASLSGGKVLLTQAILARSDVDEIIRRVRQFNAFDKDNDPHHEHDFGAFDQDETKVFWKVDYYGSDMSEGSHDPADETVTARVLTIMLAAEY